MSGSAQAVNPFELQDSIIIEVESVDRADSTTEAVSETIPVPAEELNVSSIESNKEIAKEDTQAVNPFELVEKDELTSRKDSSLIIGASGSGSIENSKSQVAGEKESETILDEIISEVSQPKVPVPNQSKNILTFIVALVSGLLLSIVFTSKRIILSEINKSLRNMNYMKLFLKDERNGFSLPFVLLMGIYALNVSVFIRFLSIYFEVAILAYNFWFILTVVILLLVVRHLSLTFISYLRKRLPDALQYSFIIMMINTIVGLVLLPINLLIAYGPEAMTTRVMYFGVFLVISLWILKWLQGFLNSIRIILGDSFHFLLYLCACEIVPILICIGYVRNLIH